MEKAKSNDFEGRIREVLSDPNNRNIPRVIDAGKIINGCQIMHNGLKVVVDGYCGEFITRMLKMNKGVHEPQEERIFMEILRNIPDGGIMIELGSYWAFYSMWFLKNISDSRCYMIEPDEEYMNVGKKNFQLNGFNGDFTLGKIGGNGISIDDFLHKKRIDFVNLLHSDIQGDELNMLLGAEKSMQKNKIGYIIIGTHSQKLHYDCLNFLEDKGYLIIASIDYDYETYCFDGILVAGLKSHNCLNPMKIALRSD